MTHMPGSTSQDLPWKSGSLNVDTNEDRQLVPKTFKQCPKNSPEMFGRTLRGSSRNVEI